MAMAITITQHGIMPIERALKRLENNTQRVLGQTVGVMAHELRRDIVTGIRKQAPGGIRFKALADSTRAQKKSSKALIDHGDLIRSVNVTNTGQMVWFVGVHRSVIAPDGQPMWNIAEIHEFGSRKVKDRPPARPFLRPSYAAWKLGAEKRFASLIGQSLGLAASGRFTIQIEPSTGDASGGGIG